MRRFGLINNKSLITRGSENEGLLVTVNGGEDFKVANFVFPLDIKDTTFFVEDLPYLENGKLHIKLFAPEQIGVSYGNYYKFASVDNGLNWQVE